MNVYLAQNLPKDAPPLQRTIEEVNSDGVPITEVTTQSQASAQAGKEVLFGLGAILLLLVAVGGVVIYWRSGSKVKISPPQPPSIPPVSPT